jgi:long-subunit fatty acid transport protein
MKKLILFTVFVCFIGQSYGGGILTNGNQSAQYIRMLSRNASTSVDAVYFNPAGLMKMDNGFYFAMQNQSLFQTKTIESGFPLLNTGIYEGKLTVPVFPTAFAVYKRDRFALSLGLGPNSGGGSAEFNKGLPSFEKSISKLVPGLAGLSKLGKSVSGYSNDISFKGESVYWGIQGGASFKINPIFSVYAGLRYVPASNSYDGYLRNIQVKVNGQFKNAATFLTGEVAPVLQGAAANATGAASSVQPLITAGAGTFNLAQVQGAGYINTATRTQLEQGLLGLGVSQAQINQMNITQIQTAFTSGAASLNGQAATMIGTAAALQDKLVEVKQSGTGYTPILGVNISPAKDWNIGIKYEFKTKITLINATTVDGTGLFPDKKETGSDIPAIFSIGTDYKVTKSFVLSMSLNSYHDKGVNWGTNTYGQERTIDNNTWEVAIGGQYQFTKKVAFSAGYLHTELGVSKQYQSDFSFINPGDTFGCGIEWKASPRFTVDAGMLITYYTDAIKPFTDAVVGNYTETYKKQNTGYALGLCYRFGGM